MEVLSRLIRVRCLAEGFSDFEVFIRDLRLIGLKFLDSSLALDHGLGPPVVPFNPFLGEGSPTKIDCKKKGTLILTSLLEDVDGGGGNKMWGLFVRQPTQEVFGRYST